MAIFTGTALLLGAGAAVAGLSLFGGRSEPEPQTVKPNQALLIAGAAVGAFLIARKFR